MQWTSKKAESILQEALRVRGLRSSCQLLHFTKAAVFVLPEENLVAKVSRPGAPYQNTAAGMDLVAWLYDQGAPVPRLASEVSARPLRIENSLVHFWGRENFAGRGSAPELAQLLKDFHRITEDYPGSLPELDPFFDIDRYLFQLGDSLRSEDLASLHSWRGHLQDRWPKNSDLGFGPLHGNAHRGNTALSGEKVFLLDWDLAAWGPREWDLLPETLGPRRYGKNRNDYKLFSDAYGYDVLGWRGFENTVLVRELLATLFRLVLDKQLEGITEGQRRLAYWRGQASPPLWRGF